MWLPRFMGVLSLAVFVVPNRKHVLARMKSIAISKLQPSASRRDNHCHTPTIQRCPRDPPKPLTVGLLDPAMIEFLAYALNLDPP